METSKTTQELIAQFNDADVREKRQMEFDIQDLLDKKVRGWKPRYGKDTPEETTVKQNQLAAYEEAFDWDTAWHLDVTWELSTPFMTQLLPCKSEDELTEYLVKESYSYDKHVEYPDDDDECWDCIDGENAIEGEYERSPQVSVSNLRLAAPKKYQYSVLLTVESDKASVEDFASHLNLTYYGHKCGVIRNLTGVVACQTIKSDKNLSLEDWVKVEVKEGN